MNKIIDSIKAEPHKYFTLNGGECAKLFTTLKRFLPAMYPDLNIPFEDDNAQINDLNILIVNDKITFRALNGHELACIDYYFPSNEPFTCESLLPYGTVNTLSKLKADDKVEFYCTYNQTVIHTYNTGYISSYIPAWPKRKEIEYDKMLDKLDTSSAITLEVNVGEMRKAFKNCKDNNPDKFCISVILKKENDKWVVKSTSKDVYNSKFILDKVKEITSVSDFKYAGLPVNMFDKFTGYKTLTMQFNDKLEPVKLKSSESEIFLIMPMKLHDYIDEEEWGDL